MWDNPFPPFLIWLYGRLTRRPGKHIVAVVPDDAWRFFENAIRTVPQPETFVERVVHYLVMEFLDRRMTAWLNLANSGVQTTGYIPFRSEKHAHR